MAPSKVNPQKRIKAPACDFADEILSWEQRYNSAIVIWLTFKKGALKEKQRVPPVGLEPTLNGF